MLEEPLNQREQKAIRGWRKAFKDADRDLVNRRLEEVLASLMAALRERNVTGIFFLPPLHSEVLSSLQPETLEIKRHYAKRLESFGRVEDFSGGGNDGIPMRFADGSHVQSPVASAILEAIYLRAFAQSATTRK